MRTRPRNHNPRPTHETHTSDMENKIPRLPETLKMHRESHQAAQFARASEGPIFLRCTAVTCKRTTPMLQAWFHANQTHRNPQYTQCKTNRNFRPGNMRPCTVPIFTPVYPPSLFIYLCPFIHCSLSCHCLGPISPRSTSRFLCRNHSGAGVFAGRNKETNT